MPEREVSPPDDVRDEEEPAQESGLLDVREAARFLRVSETSIRRWTDSGKLKCYRVGEARHRRFTREDLFDFLRATTEKSHSKARDRKR